MSNNCFGCGSPLNTAKGCENLSCCANSYPFLKNITWISDSYSRLGACIDNMMPSEVAIVQKFIEGGYRE